MTLNELIRTITPPDEEAARCARARWNSRAKPLGSLGLLEESLVRAAALTGSARIALTPRTLLVFCADNGVVAHGVSQCGPEVTATVARSLGAGTSTVCHMAKRAGCAVVPVDMGIFDFPGAPGVRSRRVRNGTADVTQGPAMTRAECEEAILAGASLAREQAEAGARLLCTGEMGIANTTTSAAVASVLLGLPPAAVTGRGAGLSDAGLRRKIAAIEQALSVNRPCPDSALDVLTKVGGLDLAALCGAFLGGAACRVPVVIDGFISAAAALCAARICPHGQKAKLASHVSPEPAGALLLQALDLKPLICAGMHLGEGTGAVAALPLLDMALAVYDENCTFDELGMTAYTPQ